MYKLQLIIGDTRTKLGANKSTAEFLKIINQNLAQIRDQNIYIDFCEAKKGSRLYEAAMKANVSFPVLNDFALEKRVTGVNRILEYIENLCQCGHGQRVDGGNEYGYENPERTFEEMYENTPEELQGSAYKDYMSSLMVNSETGMNWQEHALQSHGGRRGKRKAGKRDREIQQAFQMGDSEEDDRFETMSKDDADKRMRDFMKKRRDFGMGGVEDEEDEKDEETFHGMRQSKRTPRSPPRRSRRPPQGRGPSRVPKVQAENEDEKMLMNYWGSMNEESPQ